MPGTSSRSSTGIGVFALLTVACGVASTGGMTAVPGQASPAPSSAVVARPPAAQPERANPPAPSIEEETGGGDEGGGSRVAWLGVELALRLPEEPGVLVRGVLPGSPAERAGLVKGDAILSVDGETVARPSELIASIGQHHPGDRVALAVLHLDGQRLLSATLAAQPSEEALMHQRFVGSPAPPFSPMKTVQGELEANLSALRGQVVVVEFWASWCVPCRLTAPLLSAWHDRHAAEGLRVLGITADPLDLAAHGALEANMSYAVFSDQNGDTIRDYGAFALPTLFVIDRRGIVRDVVVGLSAARYREADQLLGRLLAEK